jgi:hypothetical protein
LMMRNLMSQSQTKPVVQRVANVLGGNHGSIPKICNIPFIHP